MQWTSDLIPLFLNLSLNLLEAVEANAYFYNTNLADRAHTPEILWMKSEDKYEDNNTSLVLFR